MNEFINRLQFVTWLVVQLIVVVPFASADIPNNSVAVMPFENVSPKLDDAYFAVGVHEQVNDHLAKIKDLSPITRASVLRYKGTDKSINEIASELNVATIVEGSVGYANNKVNISVRHIDTLNSNLLWSKEYDYGLTDIFAIQAEIVEHIAMTAGADLSLSELEGIRKIPTQSLDAYLSYMKGMASIKVLNPNMSAPEFYQYLDQAIALDPNFALAHAVKACGYWLSINPAVQIDELSFEEMKRIATEHTEKALELDPNLGMAYWALTSVHFNNRRKAETIEAYERTIQLRPNDSQILDVYARFLSYIEENSEQAIRLSRRGLELAPNDASTFARVARTILYAGNQDEAVELFHRSAEMGHSISFIHLWLGMMEIILGHDDDAIKELQLSEKQLNGVYQPFSIGALAYFYSILDKKDEAERLVKQIEQWESEGRYIRPSIWGLSYLAIGENDKAYDALNNSTNEGLSSLHEIKANILNDPVLKEPRFVELRKRMGLFE